MICIHQKCRYMCLPSLYLLVSPVPMQPSADHSPNLSPQIRSVHDSNCVFYAVLLPLQSIPLPLSRVSLCALVCPFCVSLVLRFLYRISYFVLTWVEQSVVDDVLLFKCWKPVSSGDF